MKGKQIISHDHTLGDVSSQTLKLSEKAPTFAAKDVEEGFVVVVFMAIHMANSHHVSVGLLIFMSRCHHKLPDVFAQTSKMFAQQLAKESLRHFERPENKKKKDKVTFVANIFDFFFFFSNFYFIITVISYCYYYYYYLFLEHLSVY